MSSSDPGAATGGIPTEPGYCKCGHLEPLHPPAKTGRGACSASTCGCRRYEAVPACCRCDRKKCAGDELGDHCAEQACAWCLEGCPAVEGVRCCREVS